MTSLPALRTTALVTVAPLVLAVAGAMHPAHLTAATAGHWVALHIALLPVFPFLALGLVLPLRGTPRRGVEGALVLLAWVGSLCYAAYYAGLDAVAGISAGVVVEHGVHGATGDELGRAGVYGLVVAVLATSTLLGRRRGVRVLPGAAVLLAACWSFRDSHIFWPRGVLTMLGFALGFALLTAACETDRTAATSATRRPSAG
jgi:hypothetical protein